MPWSKESSMTRRWLSWTLVAVALSLSACLDDPAVRERLGVDENGRAIGTPSPTATSSSSPSPEPSPAVTPSASPVAPGVTGRYEKTFDPLDLAIAGPGYFVLSTKPNPQSFDEVLFTRRGEFELAFVPA